MENLFYLVISFCVNGFCENVVVAEKPMSLKECVILSREEKKKYLVRDPDAIAYCIPETEYN